MLRILAGKTSYRKSRLFAVAACRPLVRLLITDRPYLNERIQKTLSIVEADTDDRVDPKTRDNLDSWVRCDVNEIVSKRPWASVRAAGKALEALTRWCAWEDTSRPFVDVDGNINNVMQPVQAVAQLVVEAVKCAASKEWNAVRDHELKCQSDLLRDIFGNPFRASTSPPAAWLNMNVIGLAQAVYDERAFDRMPILADALEDAGCTNGEFLNHCRSDRDHVRGCWVVDLLLGKA